MNYSELVRTFKAESYRGLREPCFLPTEEVGQSKQRRVQRYRCCLERLGSFRSSRLVGLARSRAKPALLVQGGIMTTVVYVGRVKGVLSPTSVSFGLALLCINIIHCNTSRSLRFRPYHPLRCENYGIPALYAAVCRS